MSLKIARVLVLLTVFCGPAAIGQTKPSLDWNSLSNPVLAYPEWSIKDSAMAYRDHTYYVFFSAFYPKEGETISTVLAVFARVDPRLRESITFDNDTAFAQHALLRTMRDMTTWFCDAYASWQKGGIENANGRLRRWLPRHLDIDRTSDQDIQEILLTTNLTPRKCLGFKTPFQALLAELGRDVQIRFS